MAALILHDSTSADSPSMLPKFGTHGDHSHNPISRAPGTFQSLEYHWEAETKRKDIATNTFFFFNA